MDPYYPLREYFKLYYFTKVKQNKLFNTSVWGIEKDCCLARYAGVEELPSAISPSLAFACACAAAVHSAPQQFTRAWRSWRTACAFSSETAESYEEKKFANMWKFMLKIMIYIYNCPTMKRQYRGRGQEVKRNQEEP
uniref:Uncharacterized protein n=1 Tax=Panagrellus redivivus TaxID=6233 RepID=A0A7E4UXH2_PANRE